MQALPFSADTVWEQAHKSRGEHRFCRCDHQFSRLPYDAKHTVVSDRCVCVCVLVELILDMLLSV